MTVTRHAYRDPAGPGAVPYLTLPAFEELTHGRAGLAISTRHGGVSTGHNSTLNLGLSTGDDPDNVAENRARLSRAVGAHPSATVGMSQVHGLRVALVGPAESGTTVPATDGLVTTAPGLVLRALAADCVPVALCDRRRRAIAAVHAGWRGIVAGVVPAAVALLRTRAATDPSDLVAALGPCIGPCHYQVGPEVAEAVAASSGPEGERPVVLERDGSTYLALQEALTAQLRACGIPAANILACGLCTACRTDLLYSHRAEGRTGRFGLLTWLAT